ncbi:hypothetical protein WMF36_05050 [Sorangium sp. So ce887]
MGESAPCAEREICTILEKNPACLRQHGLLSCLPESMDLVATYGIDGLAEQLRDIEAVEDMSRHYPYAQRIFCGAARIQRKGAKAQRRKTTERK